MSEKREMEVGDNLGCFLLLIGICLLLITIKYVCN